MPGIRVALDTNILVSGLAYPTSFPGRILTAWRQGALNVVSSRYILDKMVRVLPRLSRITLSPSEIRDLADCFLFLADIVDPINEQDAALRDQADQPVLGTLRASGADYLITGDKDLLALRERYRLSHQPNSGSDTAFSKISPRPVSALRVFSTHPRHNLVRVRRQRFAETSNTSNRQDNQSSK
jgi:uncharacterized protein